MIVIYLNNNSYANAAPNEVLNSFKSLNEIIVDYGEINEYYYHSSFFEEDSVKKIFMEKNQFTFSILPQILNRFREDNQSAKSLIDLNELDIRFPKQSSAFYGFSFPANDANIRFLINKDGYIRFINTVLECSYSYDIWKYRETLFPHLTFCPSTQDGLANTPCYREVMRYLIGLESYLTQEGTESFDLRKFREKTGMDISPESSQTLGNSHYKEQRTFLLPNGASRLFSLHLKPKNARIYILPENNKIYLGYIGKHLPTIEFPH